MMRPQHVEVRRREIALQVTKPLIEQATVLRKFVVRQGVDRNRLVWCCLGDSGDGRCDRGRDRNRLLHLAISTASEP
jgi:hypothetical protein